MIRFLLLLSALILAASCQKNQSDDELVCETFVHKYGFETSKKDWEERERDGKVVSKLKSGVSISTSYENGQLHGPSTKTFPHSAIIENETIYDHGEMLREKTFDTSGVPIQEKAYEYDDRIVVSSWDESGVPISIEEYENDLLMEGKYYTPEHELEASVAQGFGDRTKRDRKGLLLASESIENGRVARRTTFHPNGNTHTITHYKEGKLHGLESKFTSFGQPLMELNWNMGILDGPKIVYRNGYQVAVIPYINGKKEGVEIHYDDLGNLTAEIPWKSNKKHGVSKLFSEESTESEWFFRGKKVPEERFRVLFEREQIVSDFLENEVR